MTASTHTRPRMTSERRDILADLLAAEARYLLAAEARYLLAARVRTARLARPGISAANVANLLGCELADVVAAWPVTT